MKEPEKICYEKRGEILVKHLQQRHFDAYYCSDKQSALQKALELIPEGAAVAWGGAMSAQQIGLLDAISAGNYDAVPSHPSETAEQQRQKAKDSMFCDVFITGANGLSLDGQMVNIDGTGNRVAATIYGPGTVLVIAGMNKVEPTLEDAVKRARNTAAPMNMQRFTNKHTPCAETGICGDCKSADCICNQIVITRHCRPTGRIKFILVGEDLGL